MLHQVIQSGPRLTPVESAHRAVNAWRGQCVALYARAETVISEALDYLNGGSANLARYYGAGSRIDPLLELLRCAGQLHAAEAVSQYAVLYPLRVFLCRGRATARPDNQGGRSADFVYYVFARDGISPVSREITDTRAKAKHAELYSVVQHLERALAPFAAKRRGLTMS